MATRTFYLQENIDHGDFECLRCRPRHLDEHVRAKLRFSFRNAAYFFSQNALRSVRTGSWVAHKGIEYGFAKWLPIKQAMSSNTVDCLDDGPQIDYVKQTGILKMIFCRVQGSVEIDGDKVAGPMLNTGAVVLVRHSPDREVKQDSLSEGRLCNFSIFVRDPRSGVAVLVLWLVQSPK